MENSGFMVKLLTSKDILFYGEQQTGKTTLANFIKVNSKYEVNYVDISDALYFNEFIKSEDYKKNEGLTIFITLSLDTAIHISDYFKDTKEITRIRTREKLPF